MLFDPALIIEGRSRHSVKTADDAHCDAAQHLGRGPNHRVAVPIGQIPDRSFAESAPTVNESDIVEALPDGLAREIRPGQLADMLHGRKDPFVLDCRQCQRARRAGFGRSTSTTSRRFSTSPSGFLFVNLALRKLKGSGPTRRAMRLFAFGGGDNHCSTAAGLENMAF
jgi:hypothetical protein